MGKYIIIKDADFSNVAILSENKTKINVVADPTSGGTVSGSGSYSEGDTVTIKAIANAIEGYIFKQWDDGNTNASRIITVGSSNTTYTAMFVDSGVKTIPFVADEENVMWSNSNNVGGTIQKTADTGTAIMTLPYTSGTVTLKGFSVADGGYSAASYPLFCVNDSDIILSMYKNTADGTLDVTPPTGTTKLCVHGKMTLASQMYIVIGRNK